MIFIYKLSFPNSKDVYIGITSNLKRRMWEHKSHRFGVTKYHGHKEFEVEILEEAETKDKAIITEKKWHMYFDKLGFNNLGKQYSEELSCRYSTLRKKEYDSGSSKARVDKLNENRKVAVMDQFGNAYSSMSDCARKIGSYPIEVLKHLRGERGNIKGFELRRDL